jgi:hypothetical protein
MYLKNFLDFLKLIKDTFFRNNSSNQELDDIDETENWKQSWNIL